MDTTNIAKAYAATHKRLFLLDYDGTLADFNPDPQAAKPAPALLRILASLAHEPANVVVIISGREHTTLDAWLGRLPLGFAAEHGLFVKEVGQAWRMASVAASSEWKPIVREVMEQYAAHLTGALVEEKSNALVWHCRAAANQQHAEQLQQELANALGPLANSTGLRILRGNKVVEVQPAGINKGKAARHWLEQADWDFILAAGDDTTDEDLLAAMPAGSFTIKIGVGPSAAGTRLSTPAALRALLAKLAATGAARHL